MRWVSRWLDRRGLGGVADGLDAQLAAKGDVKAMHALARRALSCGRAQDAVVHAGMAINIEPADASLWCTLGAAYRHADRFDDARQAYERALELRPSYPEALSNLGEWCIAKRKTEEAVAWFDKALQSSPRFFEARLNRIAALFELGRLDAALEAAEQLIADHPDSPEACLNLGNVYIHAGKAKQGIKHYQRALELRPGYMEAHFNLATLLGSQAELANAIGYLERQIKEKGEAVQLLGFLAAAYFADRQVVKAEEFCNRTLQRQPDNIIALVTLGSCLSSTGNSPAALDLYEKIIALDNKQAAMFSNILFEYNNLPQFSPDVVFRRHLEWARLYEQPLLGNPDFSARNRDPRRRLKIGYVSGDFVNHPVGILLRDVLRHHDRTQVEVHCFSMVIRADDVLPELREAADHWEDVFFLSDDEFVELVRKKEIDILVDLSGHTAYHRLLAFARRPAPIQAEWIGYFHSTGMNSIDYFITDPHTTPPGCDQLFSEIPVYLPHSRFCYDPPHYAPAVAAPPCERNGFITFGSFNRLSKLTDEVVAAWSRILSGVPDSRLVLKAGFLLEQQVIDRVAARFEALGVARDRLELRDRSPHGEMYLQFGDIDIALDTFPFTGGMTTLDALWMGVPVVTVVGHTMVSRQSYSALANIGLADELAFDSVGAYVRGAIALARDPVRVAALRREIRPRVEASPLRQAARFAKDIESLMRAMWRAWCEGKKLPNAVDTKELRSA